MTVDSWSERNQAYLVDSINQVKSHLERYISKAGEQSGSAARKWQGESPPALERLSRLFGLSDFERFMLVLCAGAELDAEVSQLCARAQGSPAGAHPTFGLALAALPGAHWSALTPASPLRRFRLVDLYGPQSLSLTASPLKIEERVLHYLTGISYLEKQLQGFVRPARTVAILAESHMRLVGRIMLALNGRGGKRPAVLLWGADGTGKLAIAGRVCAELGLDLWQAPADLLPSKADEVDSFVQLWTRESALLGAGLYISAEDAEPATQRLVRRLADEIPGVLFVGTSDRWPQTSSATVTLEVKKPEKEEQRRIWNACLGELSAGLDDEVSRLVSQFDLSSSSIQAAAEEALLSVKNGGHSLPSALWESSRVASRPKMSDLAQHISPKARMEDFVLPEREKLLIRDIAIHVRQRDKVYREWGWGANSGSRGLGIAALFAGESGTGKTMAAEVLANELDLDLFRIDLSMVVSKYIGETEKNLRQVFDAAEDGGAILFFDEADALFGKRSEVRDSHDRYANIEVGYLLQRMESYRGLAILTTNLKNAIDTAFLRRIRFVVNFPFPDEKSRAEIWRRVFPKSTPLGNLDYDRLARMNITGGSIRNIALGACFLAAEQNMPVNMDHIKQAAKSEYDKMERPLTRVEIGD
jgi:AAA+ superfamily predicted ATPase